MLNGLNILPSYSDYFGLTDPEKGPALTGLMTASIWIGGILAGISYGWVADHIGRRPALFWAAVITFIAVIVQSASQNIGMFVFARILVGYGTTASGMTGPAYLAETLPLHHRAWGLGLFNDFYYVGGLLAAGITYKTIQYNSTWSWRTPSLIQGLFSIICIAILPFVPESPRWLAFNHREAEARTVIALTYANGDTTSPIVVAQYKQIEDTIAFEKNVGETLSMKQLVKTPSSRKRVMLAVSCAVFSTIAGNVAASYYLGPMLNNAGITEASTQLEINVILNAFCLVCSIGGTWLVNIWGRKPMALLSTSLLTLFIFMIGALTKVYGASKDHSGIYATVASIFLFQGAYSLGWTPILYLYPPEVLNYPIRANGMGIFQLVLNGTALLFVFIMPIALANMAWRVYFINGSWNILMIVAIAFFWIETKGKTLEEIDEAIEGMRHSDAPGVEDLIVNKGAQIIVDGNPAVLT
ncbi:MFS sugar transporter-like protein [Venturia nashicola]|nr:MFS sugar transporter-like protein [Venturia nashicola]